MSLEVSRSMKICFIHCFNFHQAVKKIIIATYRELFYPSLLWTIWYRIQTFDPDFRSENVTGAVYRFINTNKWPSSCAEKIFLFVERTATAPHRRGEINQRWSRGCDKKMQFAYRFCGGARNYIIWETHTPRERRRTAELLMPAHFYLWTTRK